jgi:hypothetical protein
MVSRKTWIVGSALAALGCAALAMPTGAADPKGTLAIVNGIPGKRVDVCLNRTEIRSGLRYGGFVLKDTVNTGAKTVRVYARDARRCGGKLLAQTAFPLGAGDDLTIVATKHDPKVLTFDNSGLGEIPPLGTMNGFAPYAWRNAADVSADFSYRLWGGMSDHPVDPSGIFAKGQENANDGLTPNNAFQFRAIVDGDPDVLKAPIIQTVASHRYEWILVGTARANARFVFIDRVISHPSP